MKDIGVINSAYDGNVHVDPTESAMDLSPVTPNMVYGPNEDKRMLKNVFVISLAFAFLFTACQSMANLQSSLNTGGLGTYSLCVIYGSMVVSSMFLPTFLIRKLTAKWTLVLSALTYSTYIAAQFKPSYGTLIPFAIVIGLGAAPLWSAKCTILTHIGYQYSQLIGSKDAEVVIVRFFGIFFLFFQSSTIWGSLIFSAVLSQDARNCTNDIDKICGVNFCPNTKFCNSAVNATDAIIRDSTRYTLAGIYLACSLTAAVILAIFLDPLTRYGENERVGSSSKLDGKQLFNATFKHMKQPIQILMIPLTIWSGMEQGFFGAEYTAGYVNCAWGIEKIGYVLICFGVVDAIGSVSCAPIVKFTGRIVIFIFGAAVNVSTIVIMMTWRPDPDHPIMFFVVAGLWGLGDAVWQTQINALYGVLFPQDEEPAFSNYRLWESIGFILAYTFSNVFCVNLKLYILLGVLFAGMTGYFIVEFIERRTKSR